MIQLFQIREVERTFSSFSTTDLSKKYFSQFDEFGFIKADTCQIIDNLSDLETDKDIYNYSEPNVEHNRTFPVADIPYDFERKGLNQARKDFENSPNLKRPTDIIIYTDGFSYSSTSTFIKGFQNIGGAITVGYFGNPKIKGPESFDASQSDSGVMDFEETEVYENLEKLGYMIYGITSEEVFDDSYQKENPIPREYTIFPVDYRVDIYSPYSDEIYPKFISEGLKIFDLFNNKNYCNSKNEKLLLHDENCYDMKLKYTHGGYKCGENFEWDKSTCVPYYCDIGYSFDQYNKECVPDCESESEVFYIYKNNYTNKINIERNVSYMFIPVKTDANYVFESSEDIISQFPKICFINGYNQIIVNEEKNGEQDYEIKINQIYTDLNFINYKGENLYYENVFLANNKQLFIFQSSNDHLLHLINLFNLESNKIKYLIYNDSINYQDILNVNEKYFEDYSGDIFNLTKNNIYIIYPNYDNIDSPNQVYVSLNSLNEKINFTDNIINFLYLQKEKDYEIIFPQIDLNITLKLSRNSLDTEILLGEKKILDSNNLYYELYFKDKSK